MSQSKEEEVIRENAEKNETSQTQKLAHRSFEETFIVRYGRKYSAFSLTNIRRLPIVGDVHLAREEWPSSQQDWVNLWSLPDLPAKLSRVSYSINERA